MISRDSESNSRLDDRWEIVKKTYNNGDMAGALYLLRKMADEGVAPTAFAAIGNIYEVGGGGVEQDSKKAKHWFHRAICEANDIDGYFGMARLYYFGLGVDINYKKVLEYYQFIEEESVKPEPFVYCAIGRMYQLGQGVDINFGIAKKYYQEGIALGSVQALAALGRLEIQSGNIFLGCYLRIKATLQAVSIFIKNKSDRRLIF